MESVVTVQALDDLMQAKATQVRQSATIDITTSHKPVGKYCRNKGLLCNSFTHQKEREVGSVL
jgi:hypothetical protein